MLKLEHITVGYDKDSILRDVSMKFLPGSITSIIGPNGSGKSTLLRVAAGLMRPFSGTVLIKGQAIEKYSGKERAREIAYLPQQRLMPDMSVGLFLLMSRYPYKKPGSVYTDQDRQIIDTTLDKTGLTSLKGKKIKCLSGGERQKVFLAATITQETDICLLDEPCTHLDLKNQLELLNMIRNMREEGKTIIVVFHDLLQAFDVSDEIYIIDKGKVVGHGKPRQLMNESIIHNVFSVQIGEDGFDTLYGFKLLK